MSYCLLHLPNKCLWQSFIRHVTYIPKMLDIKIPCNVKTVTMEYATALKHEYLFVTFNFWTKIFFYFHRKTFIPLNGICSLDNTSSRHPHNAKKPVARIFFLQYLTEKNWKKGKKTRGKSIVSSERILKIHESTSQ